MENLGFSDEQILRKEVSAVVYDTLTTLGTAVITIPICCSVIEAYAWNNETSSHIDHTAPSRVHRQACDIHSTAATPLCEELTTVLGNGWSMPSCNCCNSSGRMPCEWRGGHIGRCVCLHQARDGRSALSSSAVYTSLDIAHNKIVRSVVTPEDKEIGNST